MPLCQNLNTEREFCHPYHFHLLSYPFSFSVAFCNLRSKKIYAKTAGIDSQSICKLFCFVQEKRADIVDFLIDRAFRKSQ
nr:MAG TPA: hypothetical protein [Caudoviricetes sp.]